MGDESLEEIMARALLRHRCDVSQRGGVHPIAWGELNEQGKNYWLSTARAAIAAIEAAGYEITKRYDDMVRIAEVDTRGPMR